MTSKTIQDDQSSFPDPADPELEQLLEDAYEAPPVPHSLLKRIDQAVEAEWGHSPGVASHPHAARARTVFAHGKRWVRAIPLAATLATMILIAIVLNTDSRAYAWETMLDALEQKGIVQTRLSNGIRWLSLSEGVIGERTGQSTRILDLDKGVYSQREDGRIRHSRLAPSASPRDKNRLLLAFLAAPSISLKQWHRFRDAEIVEQNWKRIGKADLEEILLQVQLAAAEGEKLRLDIRIDSGSHLPITCDSPDQSDKPVPVTSLELSYPNTDAARLQQEHFGSETVRTASKSEMIKTKKLASRDRIDPVPDPSEPAMNPTQPGEIEKSVLESERTSSEPLEPASFSDPPSQWQPVHAVDRSSEEVLERINSLLTELWNEKEVNPVGLASDEELMRRVYIDLTGRTPSVQEARQYLNDESPNRYERLVSRLLESRDHSSHLATTWRRFLIPDGIDLAEFGGVEAFDRWLAERFRKNESYDAITRDLLLAEGRLSRSGPLLFYSAVKLDPDQLAARTSRVFLGMRLECAQCHDHPFESWTQKEFWSFAAFFGQISRPQAELESVSTVMRVRDIDRGEVTLPGSDKPLTPAFLDGSEIDESSGKGNMARREKLARWLSSPRNPYFARATVNRVWAQMFGEGIVDPVDDFGTLNQPKSPELLDLLAGHFINSHFDLRELFRTVVMSKAYRLSSGAKTVDEERSKWFAQMNVKTFTAEQVYDCITVAAMLNSGRDAQSNGVSISRFGNSQREQFLQQFRTPGGNRTDYQAGIPQALTLMNGTLIDSATGLASSGLLKSLEAPFFTNQQRVEVLYLATLSRRPSPSEWELLKQYIPEDASGAETQEVLADILWALLNSAEFTMNH